ncbi:DNA-directed RNA polymerase II subunit GRINL1A-like isoform X2 [Liolophura sinensis]|uniref:DNA-directed RNA polymerase II subunit GRINL1A-like isoform X1 n=1 Tax=Liolophura sinensis TaxID=3198878 RepID=UPI0031580527
MPGSAPEHQGYLGDLHTKSTVELMDLLRRQEAILQKQTFLRSLPDGGRKVRAFADTLQRIITERKEQEMCQTSQIGEDMQVRMLAENTQVKSDSPSSVETAVPGNLKRATSQFAKLRDKNTASGEVTEAKPSSTNEDFCLRIQSLSVRDKVSMDTSEADAQLAQLMNTAQHNKVYMMKEHPKQESETVNSYLKVMQKSEQASASKKEHFKPNSSLKIRTLEELPKEYRGTGVAKQTARDYESVNLQADPSGGRNPLTGRIMDVKTAESSATPPKYKYDRVRTVSLDESFQLQKVQAMKQEELRAQHAAMRLAGKIHVKMGVYNPEGKMAMAYRSQNDDDKDDHLDSDDNPEEDYPEEDYPEEDYPE